jgi:hypothetical protein
VSGGGWIQIVIVFEQSKLQINRGRDSAITREMSVVIEFVEIALKNGTNVAVHCAA